MSAFSDRWACTLTCLVVVIIPGCNPWIADATQDQAYYEGLAYDLAYTYDIVHGVALLGALCAHDLVMDCPSGEIADPATIEIESDWMPSTPRLDRSLPIFGAENAAGNLGFGAYITLGRFSGLEFQPDANVVCGGQPAVPGWRNFVTAALPDSILENRGIDHEGLRAAIERGIADSDGEVSAEGGTHQILCGASPE